MPREISRLNGESMGKPGSNLARTLGLIGALRGLIFSSRPPGEARVPSW